MVNYMYEPVLTEYGAFKYNLLKQLNKFIGKVRSHEGFHGDRDVFWILGFRESSLHHLQTNNKSAVTCDFQQCGILTNEDSNEPVQPCFKLRNSK